MPSPVATTGVLVVSDAIALFTALALATLFVAPALLLDTPASTSPILLIMVAPLAFGLTGLYPATALGAIEEFRRLGRAIMFVVLGSLLALALFTELPTAWLLLVAGAFAVVSVPLCRAATREVAARQSWWGEPVVILGAGETARLLIERLRDYPRIGLKPVACLDDDPHKVGGSVSGVAVTGTLADADTFVKSGVRIALVAMPGIPSHELVHLVRQHTTAFRSILVVPNLFGLRSIGVETRDLGGVLGLHVRHNLVDPVNRIAKRLLDIVLVLPAILIGLPLMMLAALAIMMASPGTPFFYQERAGLGGTPIRVWKLRTMYVDALERLDDHLERDPAAKAEWARHYKLAKDPRIIPVVGPMLRMSSLDELPQIINVLRGEMSFVGPRPFPAYHLAAFHDDFLHLRSTVRPGITGLWQVSARSDGDLRVQEESDTYYIRNWSLWMDLYVLARTPLAVLTARGAR